MVCGPLHGQGIQHYLPIEFFGGEDALTKRKELDQQKKDLCLSNQVRLIEWPYSFEPTAGNIQETLRMLPAVIG